MEQPQALRITLHPDDAEQLAVLKQILEEELEANVTITTPTASGEAQTKSPDWAAVAALALAVPGAALAIKDLTDRLRRKKQVDQALERVRKEVKTTTNRVIFTYPDGTVKTVEQVTTTEILDHYDASHA